ncbi:hypothetical protein DFJ77DRAFT_461459 [Powellomyces hirtus]|nr:hypothetical protein DFJ77DRAFT_461459 [Powellomyces hirtus]
MTTSFVRIDNDHFIETELRHYTSAQRPVAFVRELVQNSLDTITTRRRRDDKKFTASIELRVRLSRDRVEVEITDDGSGPISAPDLINPYGFSGFLDMGDPSEIDLFVGSSDTDRLKLKADYIWAVALHEVVHILISGHNENFSTLQNRLIIHSVMAKFKFDFMAPEVLRRAMKVYGEIEDTIGMQGLPVVGSSSTAMAGRLGTPLPPISGMKRNNSAPLLPDKSASSDSRAPSIVELNPGVSSRTPTHLIKTQ